MRFDLRLIGGLCLLAAPVLAQTPEVRSILSARCRGCHTGAAAQGGLRTEDREALLTGGVSGPSVVPGRSRDSLLVQRITGEKGPRMPLGSSPMPEAEIAAIRDWIDRGAPAGTDSAPRWKPSLSLKRPEGVPAERPLDSLLAKYASKHSLSLPAPVSNAAYARRVYLDLLGVPPTPEQLQAFVKSSGSQKRRDLVQSLLKNRKQFSEHWISFWNDLLHNDEGVTYIGNRKSITPYLLEAMQTNRPYDAMVQDMLNPGENGPAAGFLIGVNWRGDINASQMPVMQAAQNSAQVFLGVNLKCNSCHDSFISQWKLRDAYGLAAFFSEKPLELVRCDAPTGEMAKVKFLYPELGSVPEGADLNERRAHAAKLFTKPENGRFPRTFVNRIWQRLMGRGFVEPADDMDAEPWNPQMLDTLSADFVAHGYDIDWLLTEILTSQAYQLPAVPVKEGETSYVFRGPLSRRLTAEQFLDSVSAITGEWRVLTTSKPQPGVYAREWRFKASTLTAALGRPLRDLAVTERLNEPTTLQLLELVNGETLGELLKRGAQRLLGELPPAPLPLFDSGAAGAKPAAIDIDISKAKQLRLIMVDADSYDPTRVKAAWAEAVLEGPKGAVPLASLLRDAKQGDITFRDEPGPVKAIPAALPSEYVLDVAGKGFTRFRARAGVDETSLPSDIAPKVRFFIFDAKPDPKILSGVTGEPPAPFPAPLKKDEALVRRLFQHALARDPGAEEMRIALGLLKRENRREGLEDLLWSLVLSPEFQYIDQERL